LLYIWTKSMALGLPDIDEQHKGIFKLADDLLVAMRNGGDDGEVRRLVAFLGASISDHHRAEEACMLEFGYAGLAGHRIEHEEFAKAFAHVRAMVEREPANPLAMVAMQRNVCEWMLNHIRQSDRQFGSFATSRGFRAAA
jgi:hemerythrin